MVKMIEETIISSFFIKDKAERAKYELTSNKRKIFIWKLDKTFFKSNNIQEIIEPISSYLTIKNKLINMKCPNDCYVISILQHLDGKIMPLNDALEQSFGLGPLLISCIHGEVAYFEGEQFKGAPQRYMLIKKSL